MGITHVQASIDGLLETNSSKRLDNLFGMDNGEARKQLLELKSKGHKYLKSEGCKNFDPFENGCQCDK